MPAARSPSRSAEASLEVRLGIWVRAVAYLGLATLLLPAHLALAATSLAVAPLAWCGRRHVADHAWLRWVEIALVPGLLAGAGVSVLVQLCALLMLVGGVTVQLGIRKGLLAGMLGGAVAVVVSHVAGVAPLGDADHSLLVLGVLGVFTLTLAQATFSFGRRRRIQQIAERRIGERLSRYLPSPARTPGHAPGAVSRRWLTVVFVDLVGFTRLTNSLDAEELKPLMDAFVETTAGSAERHGGFVAKVIGDGAMMVFDASDRRAAARQALACCDALVVDLRTCAGTLKSAGTPAVLEFKAGVASGFCSLGDWGGAHQLEFTVIGRPVNLAARLQQLSRPDEVLVCERTAALLNLVAPSRKCQVNGFGELPVYRAGRPFYRPQTMG